MTEPEPDLAALATDFCVKTNELFYRTDADAIYITPLRNATLAVVTNIVRGLTARTWSPGEGARFLREALLSTMEASIILRVLHSSKELPNEEYDAARGRLFAVIKGIDAELPPAEA